MRLFTLLHFFCWNISAQSNERIKFNSLQLVLILWFNLICFKQEPSCSRGETPSDVLPRKRLQELLGPEISVSCEYNGVIIIC